MKREDWLHNKETEKPPRPPRKFNLTDELMVEFKKEYKDSISEYNFEIIEEYFESLPDFLNSQRPEEFSLLLSSQFTHACDGFEDKSPIDLWTIAGNSTTAVMIFKQNRSGRGYPESESVSYYLEKEEAGWKIGKINKMSDIDPSPGGWVDTDPPTYVPNTGWPQNPFGPLGRIGPMASRTPSGPSDNQVISVWYDDATTTSSDGRYFQAHLIDPATGEIEDLPLSPGNDDEQS